MKFQTLRSGLRTRWLSRKLISGIHPSSSNEIAMIRIAVVLLAIAGSALPAQTREAKIGGASIDLTMPAGFCELEEKLPTDQRAVAALRKLVTGSGNELLAFAADCSQLDAWRTGKRQLLDDFVQFQTPASSANKPLPLAPGEFIKQVCALTRDQAARLLAGAAPDIHTRIEETLRRVKVNETSFVGVLAEDPTACYSALLQKLQTEVGTEKTQLSVYAVTVVKGKVVYFYLFTPYLGGATVESILAKQKINVGEFIAANRK